MYHTIRTSKQSVPYCFLVKLAALFLFMVALFFIVIFILPERTAAAGDTSVRTYQIVSVQIEEGDSLWSIASEYYTEDFHGMHQYISEIKRMNQISSDTLYAGNYLLIPHYIE